MLRRCLFLGLVLLLLGSLALADTEKRIFMKDGSYQKVTQYEVQGDRVHYYSAERYQWEDVPSNLVDWTATHKFEQDQQKIAAQAAAQAAQEKADAAKQAALDDQEARTPEVATNLHLPPTGGVFAVDQYRDTPELVELTQDQSQINQHTGSYILRRTINPMAPKTASVDLPGPHASVQIHDLRPTFYLNVDTPDSDSTSDTDAATKRDVAERRPSSDAYLFQIVKLGVKRDSRVLTTIVTDAGDDTTLDQNVIPVVGVLTPGDVWVKIQPKKDLVPGEYAVVQMLSPDRINPFAWDFGVNPSAPENEKASKPGQTQTQPAANDADAKKRLEQ